MSILRWFWSQVHNHLCFAISSLEALWPDSFDFVWSAPGLVLFAKNAFRLGPPFVR
jgi:hypothetical protein